MKFAAPIHRLKNFISITILSLRVCAAYANDVNIWRSLGLGQSEKTLSNVESECLFSEVRMSAAPEVIWALDKSFLISDWNKTQDSFTIVPSEELQKVFFETDLSSQLPMNYKKEMTYGVIVKSGDVYAENSVDCDSLHVRGMRLGYFAFLTIEIHFAQVRLDTYLRNTFALEKLSPVELLRVAELLNQNLPESVSLKMRLVSNLGHVIKGWDTLGTSLALCNLGQFVACNGTINNFSSRLQAGVGVAELVSTLKRQATLLPDASVLGNFVSGNFASIELRLKSRKIENKIASLLSQLKTELSQSNKDQVEKLNSYLIELSKEFAMDLRSSEQELSMHKSLAILLDRIEKLIFLNRSFLACEKLEINAFPLLERILVPLTFESCTQVVQKNNELKSWKIENITDLNELALPLLISKKFVQVSDSMANRRDTSLFLMNLPLLEEVKVPYIGSGVLIEMLERSGVRLVKE